MIKPLAYGTLLAGVLCIGTIIGQTIHAQSKYHKSRRAWVSSKTDFVHGRPIPDPIEMVMMGDSIGAGCGTVNPDNTIAGVLSKEISDFLDVGVYLRNISVSGSKSKDLLGQLDKIKDRLPDVVFISIGANDVLHSQGLTQSISHLSSVTKYLTDNKVQVFVLTCPDLGGLHLIPQPLRYILGRIANRYGHAQSIDVERNGGYAISVNEELAPLFISDPEGMFGPDRFHPSEKGYTLAAKAMLPVVLGTMAADLTMSSVVP